MAQNPGLGRARRFALCFKALLERKRVVVRPYDLLAGRGQHVNHSASIPATMPERFDPGVPGAFVFDVGREIGHCRECKGERFADSERDDLDYFANGVDSPCRHGQPRGGKIPHVAHVQTRSHVV